MASRQDILRGHASEPTAEYLKSIGQHAPHGELTLGFAARTASTLAKAIDLIADLNARLDRLEGKEP